jgi:hypothetical protein
VEALDLLAVVAYGMELLSLLLAIEDLPVFA